MDCPHCGEKITEDQIVQTKKESEILQRLEKNNNASLVYIRRKKWFFRQLLFVSVSIAMLLMVIAIAQETVSHHPSFRVSVGIVFSLVVAAFSLFADLHTEVEEYRLIQSHM